MSTDGLDPVAVLRDAAHVLRSIDDAGTCDLGRRCSDAADQLAEALSTIKAHLSDATHQLDCSIEAQLSNEISVNNEARAEADAAMWAHARAARPWVSTEHWLRKLYPKHAERLIAKANQEGT